MNTTDTELVNRFIELRAAGCPFEDMAKELNRSVDTLRRWSREHQVEVKNLRSIVLERRVKELGLSRDQCLQNLGEGLRRLRQELEKRDLKDVPTARLFRLISQLSDQAERFNGPIQLSEPIPESTFDQEPLPDPIETWDA